MNQDQVYRGLLFDMDGVIIDSAEEVEFFWKPRLRQKGVVLNEKEFLEKLHGRPAREIIREFFADETEEKQSELLKECEKFDREHSIRLVPGVQDLLDALREHKVPTGMVTSALHSKVSNTFRSLGTDRYFSAVVTSEDVKEGKPHPECYRKAAHALGLRAEECIVFEDSVNGIKAGHASGALVTGINKPKYTDLLKQQGAHLVIPDFRAASLKVSENNGFILFLGNQSLAVSISENNVNY